MLCQRNSLQESKNYNKASSCDCDLTPQENTTDLILKRTKKKKCHFLTFKYDFLKN